MGRVFEIALRGREIRNFAGGIFLLGEGNLGGRAVQDEQIFG